MAIGLRTVPIPPRICACGAGTVAKHNVCAPCLAAFLDWQSLLPVTERYKPRPITPRRASTENAGHDRAVRQQRLPIQRIDSWSGAYPTGGLVGGGGTNSSGFR